MKNLRNGFTLIELIGVLAIMAILASAIAPNVVHEIERAMIEAEETSIATITEAIRRSVVETRIVPGTNAGVWDAAAGPYLNLPSSSILQNSAHGTRRLLSRTTNGLGGVPYDQAARFTAGALPQGTLPVAAPINARMIIVSNLGGVAPATILNDAQFDAVWNQVGVIPAGFTENEDLRIGRCGLAAQFYPITVNCLSIANVPRWALDAAAPKSLNGGTFTVYLIVGTQISLLVGAVAQETLVMDGPRDITYDGSIWSY